MNPRHAQAIHAALALALALGAAACSIGNIHHDDCTSNEQCSKTWGPGSVCDQGFCTPSSVAEGCQGKTADGQVCFKPSNACVPKSVSDFENGCTTAQCAPFDQKRLTKLTADGGLPPLP